MCVLCGEFVGQPHWSDRKFEDQVREERISEGGYQTARRRGRIHRAKLANRVLAHYGLRLDDWNGVKYLLRDRKGRSVVIQDLGGLWPEAAKLAGRTLDPLAPELLGSMRFE